MKKVIITTASVLFALVPVVAAADTATSTTATSTFANWQGLQVPAGYQDTTPSNGATPIVTGTGMFGLQFPAGTQSVDGGSPAGQFPDGPRLIKLTGTGTIYWVSGNNLKIPMLTKKVFLSYKNKDSDVQTVGQNEFDFYQDAQYIQYGSGAVYKVDFSAKVKHPIASAAWNDAGIDDSQIIHVNKTELASYKTGSKITDSSQLQ